MHCIRAACDIYSGQADGQSRNEFPRRSSDPKLISINEYDRMGEFRISCGGEPSNCQIPKSKRDVEIKLYQAMITLRFFDYSGSLQPSTSR